MKYRTFILIIFVFMSVFFGFNSLDAQSCQNPGPADSGYEWVHESNNCWTAGSYGSPMCSWNGGTCGAGKVGQSGNFEEYSGPPSDILFCNTWYVCRPIAVPEALCVINSFTADSVPAFNTGTTLRFSLSGNFPWTIEELQGSVSPYPNSGTGSGTSSTGNLTSQHIYRLSCGNSTRDLTVTPSPQVGFVNLNFNITDQNNTPISGVNININQDFGNGTSRSTNGGGFANFGVHANTSITYTVERPGGCDSGSSGTVNSGPAGRTVNVSINCSVPPPPPPQTCQVPGATNIGGPLPCVFPSPAPSPVSCNENASVVVIQPLPSVMTPGQTAQFTIRVNNTGDTRWYHGSVYRFLKKSGNLDINPTYGHLPGVLPGDDAQWTFSVTAPAVHGDYYIGMQMIHTIYDGGDYIKPDGTTCPGPAADTYFGNIGSVSTRVAATACTLPLTEWRSPSCADERGPEWYGMILEGRTKNLDCSWGNWNRVINNCTRNYTLAINTSGSGSGQVSGAGSYSAGHLVTPTYVLGPNSVFGGWSGDCNSVTGSVTMNSNKVCTATFNLTPPPAPINFRATPSNSCGNNWLNLSWNDTPNTDFYRVYRGGNMVYEGSNIAFLDAGLVPGVTYNYTLRAYNVSGQSAQVLTSGTVSSPCPLVPDLTAGGISPNIATVGTPLSFSASISNIGNGSTGSGFENLFQARNPSGVISVISVNTKSALSAGASSNVISSLYNFASAGVYSVRVCVDNNAVFAGTIAESNEGNNCGVWTNINVLPAPAGPSGSITAGSCTIPSGSSVCSSVLNWSTANSLPGSTITVTKDNPNSNVSTNASGINVSSSVTFGPTTFSLYHNGSHLSSATITTSCAVGSTWDNTICKANTPQHQIEVNPKPSGGRVISSPMHGINCGNDCDNLYDEGTSVSLQAVSNSSYWQFDGWTGACAGFGLQTQCIVNVNEDKVVGARFILREFKYEEI